MKGNFVPGDWLSKRLIVLFMAISQIAVADVTITRLANDGVILDDGETRIMIDGFVVESYALYGGLPPLMAQEFATATGIFENIEMAFVSHKHHDHNQPEFTCNFLRASDATRLITSVQVIELVRERCRVLVTSTSQVATIDPKFELPMTLPVGTAKVTIIPLSHGKGKYARLENWGHVVEMGGVRVLHIGDAAMDPTDFEAAAAELANLDVALIPFWYFQPGPGMEVVNRFLDAPHKLAVQVPPQEVAEATAFLATDYPEVVVLEQPGDQFVVSSTEVASE
jgi:L-ascorbate metabolism protein UlaG (beta-lactamase superfamily)